MGVASRSSLEEHLPRLLCSHTMSVLVLVSLVATAWAQGAPTTPTWFLQDGFSGGFTERSKKCGEVSTGQSEIGDGPIVIPESQEANICINFPPVPERNLKGGWRHDRGEKGACTSGCCDFQPPTSKKVEKIHPTWFETKSDCSDSSGAVTGPIYFHGAERQEKTLCIQINADGEFAVHRGELGTCRYGCCIFYGGREWGRAGQGRVFQL